MPMTTSTMASTDEMSADDAPRKTLDEAVDGYMHLIARTRPWTKKREEALLDAFSDWLHDAHGPVALAAVTPALVQRYADACPLTETDADELRAVLRHVFRWAAGEGMVGPPGG